MRGLKRGYKEAGTFTDPSHALRVRGLKRCYNLQPGKSRRVARSTRAWIETSPALERSPGILVARSTRAWIETEYQLEPLVEVNGRTLYACVD